jgi:hypothetical protein
LESSRYVINWIVTLPLSSNRMSRSGIESWKWAVWGALAITLLSVYPQLVMWGVRGREWNGSFAEVDGDEWAYSAYIQALIDGRPRRNDPYTGREESPGHPVPESLFSIQFVPAYAIAGPARLLGASSSTAFIALAVLAPFFSCLAIFWLITNVIKDHRLAAVGSVVVLCFGALGAGQGVVHLLTSDYGYSSFLFLRRYEPLAPFPLFFVFCVFVWRMLTAEQRFCIAWSVVAGLTLGLLIFSYFYLWTSAVAWFMCMALLWVVARPKDLRTRVWSFATILMLALGAVAPYALLLSRRSVTMDSRQKMALSHAPDLLRIPELLGFGVIVLIIFSALRGRINWRAPESLFAASFALMPLVVFNQQVITGRSLQPFHYEVFIANYVALLSAVLAIVIIWRRPQAMEQPVRQRILARLLFVAILWGLIEVVAPTKLIVRISQFTDRAAAICQRLGQLAKTDKARSYTTEGPDPRPLVLASDDKVALILPTFAPHALLWESHFDFLDLHPNERRERFYKYLYYTGIDESRFAKELGQPMSTLAAAAFGHERVIPDQSLLAKPITGEEIAKEVAGYQAYASSFTREKAAQHLLSYVIVPADGSIDLSNLDRWYERDRGDQVGDHILYRVQLRP